MCERSYFLNYVLGLPSKSGLAANKGNVVHKALEILALARIEQQKGLKSYKIDVDGLGVVDHKFCGSIDKIIESSLSYYMEQTPNLKWTKRDQDDCYKWTYKVIEFQKGRLNPQNLKVVDCEPFFDVEIPDDWAAYSYNIGSHKIEGQLRLKGSIDLITEVNKDTYHLIDWKTGKRKDWATDEIKTIEKLRNDPQLRIYFYAARKMYPHIKNFILTIFFINDGGPFTFAFDETDVVKTEVMLANRFKKIKATTMPKANISWKCDKFCSYSAPYNETGVSICSHFGNEIKTYGIDYVTNQYAVDKTFSKYTEGGGSKDKEAKNVEKS